ncbi:WD40 repeat-containing protein [Taphrina deformans PYCC 5710]|uniref:WD40 repeat-containing protein n=1 Tax=Taphrina deformans (strain PYCC 5710 / ATCC 11124 / CBS 356.35 / IMI 108563 / JCM 9778 / NBRC 8474) TaxID=1097556 RepID=R4XCA3_TAPDE|nr:WD40 repeat-containing protein [Taphrina deformans PYCC 5710]|eukprot:CCG83502.1 WD40 repeat-containing protein [Taphrina deformans PYCC 5710]
MSPIATHSLIATACDHPAIRLCDLRSGGYSHVLRGHSGRVIAIKWSPTAEHVFASGGSDGTVRLWDVRKVNSCIAMLDQYNSRPSARPAAPKAHSDTVNGLAWSSDGLTLVSTGHDNKLRAWDMQAGVNLLINYGTAINNTHWQTVTPLIVDSNLDSAMVFYPSDEGQILTYGLFTGYLWKRDFCLNGRVTCVIDRPGYAQVYSGDSAGQITRWDAEDVSDPAIHQSTDAGPQGDDILRAITAEMNSKPVTFR